LIQTRTDATPEEVDVPYGITGAYRVGSRLIIHIELPEHGEVSQSGRAENLVDPTETICVQGGQEPLSVKLTVSRPFRMSRRRQRIP